MKILMTADTVGGVWSYALELIRALEPFGVEVVLATQGGALSADQHRELSLLSNVELHASRYRLEWMQDCWDDVAAAGSWLLNLAEKTQPDVIHLNDYSHGALAWNVPVLIVGHSCVCSWFAAVRNTSPGPEWTRYREQVRRGLHGADLVIAPTWAMLHSLQQCYGPFANGLVIPNGRDAVRYSAGDKEPLVMAAGRLWDEAKNIRTLARAAASIAWPVVVAGESRHPDGGEVSFENVRFLGRLGSEQLADQFARASIYALPARYEPFGLSALEAALSGCALVLGDIPSLREVWGEAAVFVSPDDADELAEQVNRLIADEPLRSRCAHSARQRTLPFTPERMARQYFAAYRQALEGESVYFSSKESARCGL